MILILQVHLLSTSSATQLEILLLGHQTGVFLQGLSVTLPLYGLSISTLRKKNVCPAWNSWSKSFAFTVLLILLQQECRCPRQKLLLNHEKSGE